MSIFRTLLLALVTGLTLLGTPPRAEATSPFARRAVRCWVYYRTCPDSPWQRYYSPYGYFAPSDAAATAAWLERTYGVETFIRRTR